MQGRDLLYLLRDIRRRCGEDLSLTTLAQRAGWSRFHLHRAFRRIAGETPKQYTQRLRLTHAAARLVSGDMTVLQVATAVGFSSHEVFTRAFRRQFGCAPSRYRAMALAGASPSERTRHFTLSDSISPCIRLYHFPTTHASEEGIMATLSIAREQRAQQPILFIRRRIARHELQGMLAECFGKLFGHAQNAGLPIAGWPVARYVAMGPGLLTVEAAVPLAAPAAGEGETEAGFLVGGPVVLGIHAGPYEGLPESNAAIERWIEANGLRINGAPWESYVTDPGEHPDPADWRTEVYWPVAE